jgi:hypothetical protein
MIGMPSDQFLVIAVDHPRLHGLWVHFSTNSAPNAAAAVTVRRAGACRAPN